MTTGRPMEHKSADGMAFEHYLRSGERLTTNEWLARQQRKFNPYHDELGRFTFATGGVGASGLASRPASPLRSPSPEPAARPLGQRPVKAPATASPAPARPRRIAEIPGFPDSGKTAWRASNDYAFEAAANLYNKKYGLKPNDAEYRTPEFLKAWAMRESGGEGDEESFKTDPFQVNNPGADWDDQKRTRAGLRKGEKMTPAKSAYSALEWLRYKAAKYDSQGKIVGFRSDRVALERYNANSRNTRQSGSDPHFVWYARTILEMASLAAKRKK